MKQLLKITTITLALTLFMGFGSTNANAKSVPVKLNKSTVSLKINKKQTVKVKASKGVKIKKISAKSNKKYIKATVKKKTLTINLSKKKNGKVYVTVKYVYKKKNKTAKLTLNVKSKDPALLAKHLSENGALAIIKANDAKLSKGVSKMPKLVDKSAGTTVIQEGYIENMGEGGTITYTVPNGVEGDVDVYAEFSTASVVAGESMFSLSLNDAKAYCLPAGILKEYPSPFKFGRFLVGKRITVKPGDKINLVANPGFSNMPYVGHIALYLSGSAVTTGYDVNNHEFFFGDGDPLAYKTIAWLGSSVTYGYGSGGYSMADELRAHHPTSYNYKYAISGTTLVNDSNTSYVARMINDIDPSMKLDLLIVQLSTNDASQNKPLGSLVTTDNIDGKNLDINAINLANYNDKTIMGAIEYIIAYAKKTWNCPVIFYTGTKYTSDNYESMVNALYQISDKWRIPLVDLWGNDEMSAVIGTSLYKTYMKDNIHPTKEGYVKWWAPKFEDVIMGMFY